MNADVINAFANLAWPLVVVGAVLIFKSELTGILRRIKKLSPSGVELEQPEATQQRVPKEPTLGLIAEGSTADGLRTPAPVPQTVDEFAVHPPSPLTANVESSIKADAIRLKANPNFNQENFENLLIRAIALARIEAAFMKVYNVIFGSQIKLVRLAHERNGVTRDAALELYAEAKEKFPNFYSPEFTFEKWLKFLVEFDLIKVESDQIKNDIATAEFLMYLTGEHLTEMKMG